MRALLLFVTLAGSVVADDLLVFTLPNCAPCNEFKRHLAADPTLCDPHEVLEFRADTELGRQLGVTSVPTFILVRDTDEVARTVGYTTRIALRRWLKENR